MEPTTQSPDLAGRSIRALLYCCMFCLQRRVVYDAAQSTLTQAAGEELIRNHGWVQRKGLWVCSKCKDEHPATREKHSHLTLIIGGKGAH